MCFYLCWIIEVNKSESTTSVEIDSKQQLEQIKELVSKLYLHLNIEQFEIEREQEILKKLEQLKSEIEPMERVITILKIINLRATLS